MTVWNAKGQKKFPGVGTDGVSEAALKECDFWKYRGRGFVQLTLYPYYLDTLDPVLKAAGLPGCEAMSSDELDEAVLDNPKVYYEMLRKYLLKVRRNWAETNAQEWRQFGLTVAGVYNTQYGDLYEWRCRELYQALSDAARAGNLVLR